jgi:hypothetical protein
VIRIVDRKSYLSALDRASIEMDIHPFATFIVRRVQWRLERHDLTFPAPNESFLFDRNLVFFYGQDGEAWVRCAITREALDDHFHGDGKNKLQVFRANRQPIEQEVRRRYLAGDTEADGSILIRSGDLPDAKRPADASQPVEADRGGPEGIPGSAEDQSRAGTEESRDLSARRDDAEQPGDGSQPAEADRGGPEGIPGSAEDRSQAGPVESTGDRSRPDLDGKAACK